MIIEVNCRLNGIEMAGYSHVRWIFLVPLKCLNYNRLLEKHEHHNRKKEKVTSLSIVLERRLRCKV